MMHPDQRVSIGRNHTVQTTPLTLLTVPTGYAFEVRWLHVLNKAGTGKDVSLYWTDDSKTEDIYLLNDETLAADSYIDINEISLVLYENDSLNLVNVSASPDTDVTITGVLFIPEYQIDFTG